jgi:hypothetical protein
MRKLGVFMGVLVLTLGMTFGMAFADGKAGQVFKKGDKIYACGCGPACDCGTMAYKPGKCSCDKDLVKTTVTRVKDGKVFYKIKGVEMSAPAKGKYVCACGPECDCGTISQKPGNCVCGKPMKEVK